MEKSRKRTMLVGGAGLALASALAGGYTALAGGQHTTQPRPEAAAPISAVRAQTIDLSSGSTTGTTTFHARIQNFGAYVAGVCVKLKGVPTDDGQKCTGDILVRQPTTTLDVDLPNDASGNPPVAEVTGFPRNAGLPFLGGSDPKKVLEFTTTLGDDTANTGCFRFDETVWNFKFGQTSCSGF